MVAIASGDGVDGFGGFGADAAATTPLSLDVTAVSPAVTAARQTVKRAAPAFGSLAKDASAASTQPRVSQMKRVRLSGEHLQERKVALRIERRLASQHAPRWYERLALWALSLPLRFQRGWWDTYAVMAVMMADRPALRRVVAQEWTQALQAARRIWREATRAGWGPDDALWRLQVSELLDAAGVRVDVTHDRWGGAHYDARPVTAPHEGAMTHPTLDAVLDGRLARERDQDTWPATRAAPAAPQARPIAQPAAPSVAAFFTDWYRPLRSLDVTPPPLPRIHRAHDETDTYDPWS